MDFYNCKVRLGGNVLNEVRLSDVPAPEILILKYIHGGDAVVELEKSKGGQIEHEKERARLEDKYGLVLAKRELTLNAIFGPPHQDLPIHVNGGKAAADDGRRKRTRAPMPDEIAETGEESASILG